LHAGIIPELDANIDKYIQKIDFLHLKKRADVFQFISEAAL
jgi:hypothetical protein